MRALDTNVLIRYLIQDDPGQHRQAAKAVEDAEQRHESVFISLIVLCETVWVLEQRYRLPHEAVVAILEDLIDNEVFVVEHPALARAALDRFRKGRAGFADYLIGAVAEHAGSSTTYTFDRDLRGAAGFHVL